MHELLGRLKRIPLSAAQGLALVDTCFFLDELRHHRDEELLGSDLALLSFNAEELMHVAHRLPDDQKKHIRKFLKAHSEVKIVDIPVMPGDWDGEKAFVQNIDSRLLQLIPDTSDAVLLAAALQSRSPVLTKDKHHLFTTTLENYVKDFGIRVFKEMKDYVAWRNQ